MADPNAMDIVDAGNELLEVLAGMSFFESLVFYYDLKELSTLCVFHHQEEIVVSFDDLVELDNVRMVHLLQDFDLSGDSIDIFLLFNLRLLQNLDCHLLAGEDVRAQLDLAEGALAEGLAEDVVADGVRVRLEHEN